MVCSEIKVYVTLLFVIAWNEKPRCCWPIIYWLQHAHYHSLINHVDCFVWMPKSNIWRQVGRTLYLKCNFTFLEIKSLRRSFEAYLLKDLKHSFQFRATFDFYFVRGFLWKIDKLALDLARINLGRVQLITSFVLIPQVEKVTEESTADFFYKNQRRQKRFTPPTLHPSGNKSQ